MARSQLSPLVVELGPEPSETFLTRVDFKKTGSGDYNEAWIQRLVHEHAQVLPVGVVEPAFWPAVPVCMELPLESGFLDNLLVTPSGHIIVVECKLWRNPQARREVVAQVIDYAKDLQALTYEGFEKAVRSARREPDFDLYRFATTNEPEPLDEATFIDAVSRNLRMGRCLLLVVGDGVRDNLSAMADVLQQHAGLHFSLALVELAVFELPGSEKRFIVPSVPAKTMNIVRGIVEIRDGRPIVSAPSFGEQATTLTGVEFFDSIDRLRPGASTALKAFLDSCGDLQVCWDVGKTLRVRMSVGDRKVLPLVIETSGRVETSYPNPKDLIRGFMVKLAASIPEAIVRETNKTVFVKKRGGDYLTIFELLAHQAGLRVALETLNADLRSASNEE